MITMCMHYYTMAVYVILVTNFLNETKQGRYQASFVPANNNLKKIVYNYTRSFKLNNDRVQ